MISRFLIKWQDTIDAPWLLMPPIQIGDKPSGLGTPAKYVAIELNGQPAIRVDAYASSDECFACNEAMYWGGFVVIGWGNCVYLIVLSSGAVTKHELGMYFGSICANEEYLLVASGDRLWRLRRDGEIQWMSDILGIDGVLVREVSNGVILGDGEWDPPGGWQPFRIALETGENAN